MSNFGEMRLMRLRNEAQTLKRIKTQLADKKFVFIPGSIYRKILINFGATLDDFSALESGSIHRLTALDPDPAMYLRRVAIHRMLLTPDNDNGHDDSHHRNTHHSMNITEAGCKGLTQINENEIADEIEAFSRRSGTRYGSMPPLEYRRSSVPVAMAKLNAPTTFHAMPNISNDSNDKR